MSVPTFNNQALCSHAARETVAPPASRVQFQTMPGLDGEFVQCHGRGGRDIRVGGVLEASGATPQAAHQALKESLRQRQALVDGLTVAVYVGADGSEYDGCVLQSFAPIEAVETAGGSGAYRALVRVEAVVHQAVA